MKDSCRQTMPGVTPVPSRRAYQIGLPQLTKERQHVGDARNGRHQAFTPLFLLRVAKPSVQGAFETYNQNV